MTIDEMNREIEEAKREARQRFREAERLLPLSREMLRRKGGLLMSASDHDGESLSAAFANGEVVGCDWCECAHETSGRTTAYFSRQNGGHGWACTECRGIKQIG